MLLTRLKQLLVVVVALAIASGMVRLGYWQLDVYRDQADGYALQRAAEPARPLAEVAPPGELSQDGYGRTVTASGRYEPGTQLLVPVVERPGHYRVVTALVQSDDSRVPVVRGEVELPGEAPEAPAPPEGEQQLAGILLPSEASSETPPTADGQLGSVRLSEIAQLWDPPLVNGFVTLDEAGAAANGMAHAEVTLPDGEGQLRNGGYALQWWVFAVFGLLMAGFIARDIGRRDVAAREAAAAPASPADV
ncbi:SURF1 family protein [Auraticoccus monumenti]|uniref:SURF1-like protein n=1 Tax=Auraticoccus monumenti TaxID=675864 RepID=A0A1G6U7H8_9ACTN|nr:SURF1 family protein [Auraticoccus monumenti]SDD37263.1 Cytochrome oxidase assembly protein ShyY1 [Auraticoccus monumenti]